MFHKNGNRRCTWKGRAFSLFLAAVLLLGSVPGFVLPSSAHWADPYLDQLVDWGVMRADQTANPDTPLTRAEFMATINRAYGYQEMGEMPFEDVSEGDWFYDDVAIAYNAGYMKGTSKTTASPNDHLTREQAVCILGRNMMMRETPGEDMAFTDSRSISSWARGMVKTAVNQYIIGGFPDDSFRPKDNITKGQMAVLVTRCVGNPVNQSGTHELGSVFGNVTVTAPNVTLRNTTVSGDLYISGGVGLGGIKLENVDVLGRIVVSGTGESEGGSASVIMRNVNANELLVDNMQKKYVTVRADGITEIPKTIVRTNAYLEDNNTDKKGLLNISLEGKPGTRLDLAGRIKEVVDKTPDSIVQVAKGTVAKLTVDEAATNSTVQINRNTRVKELNLDVATTVTGEGDVDKLNINAPGSVVSMLPDDIYIRPGIDGSINGGVMDSDAAEESSLDPRLLAGYPAARDIAPTGFRADFSGNKKGTVYWAVSAITDGSIGADNLISPPSYGSKALRGGSVGLPAGDTVGSTQVSGLSVGGSYYLSAVLVDARNQRSPVKVISFSTPDNTVPAFGEGYPYMSFIGKADKKDEKITAQVAVMATKSCKMYYAVLPQGAQAPTAADMKAAAVTGNLGYGSEELVKNTVWDGDQAIIVSNRLDEQKNYVLYLWLTDGVNSSAVTSLAITTPDATPPEFTQHPRLNGNVQATQIPMAATVNEDATIYWAVVSEGADYPLPNLQSDPLSEDNEMEGNTPVRSKLDSEYAKICVKSGMSAIARGQADAKGGTEVTFNITGLQAEKAYDLYYLAQDTAGNYTVQVYRLEGGLHTLDTSGPVITQSFSSVPSRDNPNSPLSSTDIMLDFSENVRCKTNGEGKDFVSLYNAAKKDGPTSNAMKLFTDALKASVVLNVVNEDGGSDEVPTYQDSQTPPANWVVDYRKVVVEQKPDGHVVLTFHGTGSTNDPAVKLSNGVQYYFEFRNITDASTSKNDLDPLNNKVNYTNAEKKHSIDSFTTVFSQVKMNSISFDDLPEFRSGTAASSQDPKNSGYVRQDIGFRLNPESTENTPEEYIYDLLFYADTTVKYDLYYRVVGKENNTPLEANGIPLEQPDPDKNIAGSPYYQNLITDYKPNKGANDTVISSDPDENGWRYLGNGGTSAGGGQSMDNHFNGCSSTYPQLKNLSEKLYYDFVIVITEKGGVSEYKSWNGDVWFDVYIEAGRRRPVQRLSENPTPGRRDEMERAGLNGDGVVNIGLEPRSGGKYLHDVAQFPNTTPPAWTSRYPKFYNDEKAAESIYEEVTKGEGAVAKTDNVALVGDTFAWLQINLSSPGTVHYVVARESGTNAIDTKLQEKITTGTGTSTADITDAIEVWAKIPTDDESSYPSNITVTSPSVLAIAEPTYPKEQYPQGAVAYPSGGATIPIYVDGLQANTDYYVYFVLEAQSDGTAPGEYSQVFVYKFRTSQTSGPKIELTGGSSNGIATVRTQNTNSSLTYLIYTKSDVENDPDLSVLMESFSSHVSGIGDDKLPPAYQDKTNGEKYTVLQALLDDYTYETATSGIASADIANYYFPPGKSAFNTYSVFDAYADVKTKGAIYSLIKQGTLGRPVGGQTGGENRTVDVQKGIGYSPLNSSVGIDSMPHYILVTGRSTNEGVVDTLQSYTFKAAQNIRVVDQGVPTLSENGTSVSIETSDGGRTFYGDITLRFVDDNGMNKPLYWAERDGGTAKEVHQNCGHTTDNCIDISDKITVPGGATLTDSATSTGLTSLLRFHYTGMKAAGSFVITSEGMLTNQSASKKAGEVVCQIQEVRENNKLTGYRMVVFWNSKEITSATWSVEEGGSGEAPILQPVRLNGGNFKRVDEGDVSKGYQGSFTISFDRNIYLSPSYYDPTLSPVLGSSSDSSAMTITKCITGSAKDKVTATGQSYPSNSFDFTATGWGDGDSIELFKGSYISDDASNKREGELKISLKFDDDVNELTKFISRTIYLNVAMSKGINGKDPESYSIKVCTDTILPTSFKTRGN